MTTNAPPNVHQASNNLVGECLEMRYGAIHAAIFQSLTPFRFSFTAITRFEPGVGDANIPKDLRKSGHSAEGLKRFDKRFPACRSTFKPHPLRFLQVGSF